MNFLLFLFGAIGLLACHSSQSKSIVSYPQEIDSLKITDLFDSAKWDIYTWNGDVLFEPNANGELSRPFSELELQFENLAMRHDTAIMIFDFLDRGQPILPSMTQNNRHTASGVGYNINSKKKLFMVSSNVYISVKDDSSSRFVNSMQPEVLSFIRKDKEKLNPWFKQEAIRRKIIQ